MKSCNACKEILPADAFTRDLRAKDGIQSSCKKCRNARQRAWNADHKEVIKARNQRARYGVAVDLVCCAICRSEDDLCVDHDHSSRVVRGVLCRTCNLGCGYFKDEAATLRAAANYLEGTRQCSSA